MKIEDLSTLKINKLTKDQYNELVRTESVNPNEIYLTPEEDYVTQEEFSNLIDIDNLKEEESKGRVITTDETSGKITISSITATELGYLNGVESNIQEQLDDKASTVTATTAENGLMSKEDKIKLNQTNIVYGTCSTAAGTAAKIVTIDGNQQWTLTIGSRIAIRFSSTNTANNPTLNVNGTGAKSIQYNTSVIATSYLSRAGYAKRVIEYVYDGENYVFIGWSIDTSYSNATQSSAGLMTAADKKKLDNIAAEANKYILPEATNTTLGGVKVDTALNNTSTNPVQNKAIYNALESKVPTSRTINGKTLSSDINLTVDDIGAADINHMHQASTVWVSEELSQILGPNVETALESLQSSQDFLYSIANNNCNIKYWTYSGSGISTSITCTVQGTPLAIFISGNGDTTQSIRSYKGMTGMYVTHNSQTSNSVTWTDTSVTVNITSTYGNKNGTTYNAVVIYEGKLFSGGVQLTVLDPNGNGVSNCEIKGIYKANGGKVITNEQGIASGYSNNYDDITIKSSYLDLDDLTFEIQGLHTSTTLNITKTLPYSSSGTIKTIVGSGEYKISRPGTYQISLVGGGSGGEGGDGGSGGSNSHTDGGYVGSGGKGGTGGKVYNTSMPLDNKTTYTLLIGAGGTGGTGGRSGGYSGSSGSAGGNTTFNGYSSASGDIDSIPLDNTSGGSGGSGANGRKTSGSSQQVPANSGYAGTRSGGRGGGHDEYHGSLPGSDGIRGGGGGGGAGGDSQGYASAQGGAKGGNGGAGVLCIKMP